MELLLQAGVKGFHLQQISLFLNFRGNKPDYHLEIIEMINARFPFSFFVTEETK